MTPRNTPAPDSGPAEHGLADPRLAAHLGHLVTALYSPATGLHAMGGWGKALAARLLAGQRLLVAGNGGSAAEAQHLTAELVGRYQADRPPLSAIALHADTSSLTAIGNDYGPDEVFARQVAAHGRPGDAFLALSTSGASPNILAAARRARSLGVLVLAMTGPAPNPLAGIADDAMCVDGPDTSTVQEVHLVAVHALCAAIDAEVMHAQQAGAQLADSQPAHGQRAGPRRPGAVPPVPVPAPSAGAPSGPALAGWRVLP